jgi:hypothetical protein
LQSENHFIEGAWICIHGFPKFKQIERALLEHFQNDDFGQSESLGSAFQEVTDFSVAFHSDSLGRVQLQ